jgi:hypothetical protein
VSFPFDVFLSYARADYTFAVWLARSLEQGGFRVWLDEERILSGDNLKESLVRGLESAQHAVFVVTDAWLERMWTGWELESFIQDRGAGRRLVPILQIPRDVKRIGPYLFALRPVEWLEDDPEPAEARLWDLRCSLLGDVDSLGPRLEWARKWREISGEPGPALPAKIPAQATARALPTLDRGVAGESLTIDRQAQWGQLTTAAARPAHQAIFVLGPQRRGHEFFLERVERCLPKDPPRAIYTVRWDQLKPPNAKGLFFSALARAFGRPVERLAATLRAQVANQNLVLLHRPVCEKDFEDEAFLSYYTSWLPELIAEVDRAPRLNGRVGAIKVVQGIAWCPSVPVQRGLAWLGRRIGVSSSWVEESLQQASAAAALSLIRREAERRRGEGLPWLPAVCLEELPEITRGDVLEWSDFLPPGERERFVDKVMLGARDSEQILTRIREWLRWEET